MTSKYLYYTSFVLGITVAFSLLRSDDMVIRVLAGVLFFMWGASPVSRYTYERIAYVLNNLRELRKDLDNE